MENGFGYTKTNTVILKLVQHLNDENLKQCHENTRLYLELLLS